MATETHTGRLTFGGSQVAMEDGTVLAVHGPDPCATAAGRFAKFGETQPVTVTGTPGTVDNSPVLFVTSIQWAGQEPLSAAVAAPVGDLSVGGVTSLDDAVPMPTKMAQSSEGNTKAKKAAKVKSAKGGSKR